MLNAREVAKRIDWPLDKWPGNCFGVASAIVEANLVPGGTAVYGHWLGGVSEDCVVESWRGVKRFVQHGWIRCADGSVVDPTRWVFEATDPYIYTGVSDHYDEGGNQFRLMMLGEPPGYGPGLWDGETPEDGHTFPALDSDTWVALENLLKLRRDRRGYFTMRQVMWLANLPPAMLGEAAAPFFRALLDTPLAGFIPLDNRLMVLGE